MKITWKRKWLYFANNEQSEHGHWSRNLPRQAAAKKKKCLKRKNETLENCLCTHCVEYIALTHSIPPMFRSGWKMRMSSPLCPWRCIHWTLTIVGRLAGRHSQEWLTHPVIDIMVMWTEWLDICMKFSSLEKPGKAEKMVRRRPWGSLGFWRLVWLEYFWFRVSFNWNKAFLQVN